MIRFMQLFRYLVIAGAALMLAQAPAQAQAVKSGAGEPRAGATHVYLLRGLMNVFSTGMDDLADKLNRRGIRASVYNHMEHSGLVSAIAARHRAGRGERVIIVGHSLGANDAVRMAAKLGELKIHVPLVITYDPTISVQVGGNVSRLVNFYQSNNGWGARVTAGPGFRGSLSNIDLARDPALGHVSIDKSSKLHQQSIGYIQSLGGGKPATAGKPRADGAEQHSHLPDITAASSEQATAESAAPARIIDQKPPL